MRQVPPEGRQAPLASLHIAVVVSRGCDEVLALLVDAVVGEVGVTRVEVFHGVIFGGESRQALLEDVAPERVEGRDEDVDAEVELLPVDQVRVLQILLNYARIDLGNGVHIVLVYQPDSPAAGASAGLQYIYRVSLH